MSNEDFDYYIISSSADSTYQVVKAKLPPPKGGAVSDDREGSVDADDTECILSGWCACECPASDCVERKQIQVGGR